MTQAESWLAKYNEVKCFIETNKRNPSKYDAEGRDDVCTVRAFYRDEPHNSRYHDDLDDYNDYVAFINNLTYELTRICNAILSEARHLMIDFMSDFGIFSIDGITHKGNVIVKFEYEDDEIYRGLEDFIESAMTRKFHNTFDKNRIRKVLGDLIF